MNEPSSFYSDIRVILSEARNKSTLAVNTAMVEAYWLIGKRIVEEEQGGETKAAYGEALLKQLSRALSSELGRGFSYANLRNFRQFYLTYQIPEKCYALRSKLSWTHHRLVMRVESPEAREYYIRQIEKQNWSSRVLERQIKTNTYQRLISTQNSETTQPEDSPDETQGLESSKATEFIKDPYVLEFLNLPEDPSTKESDIESGIINQLQSFLLEMGNGFSFVARQMRVSTETSHFYIDSKQQDGSD